MDDDDGTIQAVIQVTESTPTTDEGQDPHPHPAFLKLLDCDLVVDQLLQYVSFKDMKTFNILSKKTLSAVRRSREFAKRTRFTISHKCRPPVFDKELENACCPYLWKNLSFDLCLPKRVVYLVADKLELVESLHFTDDYRWCVCGKYFNAARTHEVLRKMRNLREVRFNEMFETFHLWEALETPELQGAIRNLESLILRTDDEEEGFDLRYPFQRFQQNLEALSRCPLKLKKLVIGDISGLNHKKNLDSIPKMVKVCQETLEELQLPEEAWKYEEMQTIRCPNLKRFSSRVHSKDIECAKVFFEAQPLLEELKIQNFGVPKSKELFKSFEGRLAKVRKFQLVCYDDAESEDYEDIYGNDDDEVEEEWVMDFSFIEEMTKLHEFSIKSPPRPVLNPGSQLLSRLSKTIRKITFHEPFQKTENIWFSPEMNIGDYLKEFKDLTHLNLLGCPEAFTDASMQTVIKGCPKIMELAFGNCNNLSDFGISGIPRNDGGETGVPLSDLKGLVTLTIQKCDQLTPACVSSVVRFQYLRSFVFFTGESNELEDKDEFLAQICKQSPRLDSVRVTWKKENWTWSSDLGIARSGRDKDIYHIEEYELK